MGCPPDAEASGYSNPPLSRRKLKLCAVLQSPKFPQHLFSIDEPTRLDIFLRGDKGPVEGGTISQVEPVTGIKRQEVHFSPFGKLRRLVHREPAIMNTGLESHVEKILRIPHGATTARRSHPPPRSP